MLKLIRCFHDLVLQLCVNWDGDLDPHPCSLDRQTGLCLEEFDAFRYLALGVFPLLDAEACLCHGLFDDSDGVWSLSFRVYAFLGNECGYFFAERSEIVFTLLLVDLDFSFLQNL